VRRAVPNACIFNMVSVSEIKGSLFTAGESGGDDESGGECGELVVQAAPDDGLLRSCIGGLSKPILALGGETAGALKSVVGLTPFPYANPREEEASNEDISAVPPCRVSDMP
jgi:hypothetical protein